MLFVDSADKAARFIWTCNAFNIPLLFLADVPGFMIGTQVERQGIIRHGAKMISAVSEATVPKISRRSCARPTAPASTRWPGPAFEPDADIALPSASIAVMGPEAAINAVYYNQIQAIEDEDERAARDRGAARASTREDIDILHLASRARRRRRGRARGPARRARRGASRTRRGKRRDWPARRNPVTPV